MKKILMLLVLLVPFVFITNVNAEELTREQNIITYLKENYSIEELSNFVVAQSGNYIEAYILKSDGYFYTGSSYLDVYFTATETPRYYDIIYFNSDGVYNKSSLNISVTVAVKHLNNTITSTNFDLSSIYLGSTYIYSDKDKTSILFEPNYPIEAEPEPTPTLTPTPTPDVGEIDTSELDKCDSFVCNISEQVLDGFNVAGFDFLETIINFLLILLFDLMIVSPFILIFRIARWL